MEDSSFERLSTSRLTLRRFDASDAAALAAYRDDPDVALYQSWDLPYTLAAARRFIQSLATASPGAPGRRFPFAVVLRAPVKLIGDCVLRCTQDDSRHAELGFSFAKPSQGRGLASEAVAVILRYAFTTLLLQRVFACTDARNEAAQRLLDRHGFRHEGHFHEAVSFCGEPASELLYTQHRSEWLEAAGAGERAARPLRRAGERP